MAVCKFFLQGNCRFGNNCKFEHPARQGRQPQQQQPPPQNRQQDNRFAPLNHQNQTQNQPNQNRYPQRQGGGNHSGGASNSYAITPEGIQRDLTEDLPQWIFSAYGPGRDGPEQLWGGPNREISFEEMRLHHDSEMASGRLDQVTAELGTLYNQAQAQIKTVLGDLNGAISYVMSFDNKPNNRISICRQTNSGRTSGEFSNPRPHPVTSASAPPGAFGAPSNRPAAEGSGGAPGFGQPSMPAPQGGGFVQAHNPLLANPGGFGQPSGSGAGGFGQPSALGSRQSPWSSGAAGAQNPFGAQGGGNAFGQPPATNATPNPFGQPSTTNAGQNTFGQPSTASSAPNPFGQPSSTNTAQNAFGQPPTTNTGQSAFGQPSANAGQNAFGQPSTAASASNPFGQPASTPAQNAFGQPSTINTASNPFGQPSSTNAAQNPFAQAQAQAPSGGASGGGFGSQSGGTSAFGQPAQTAQPNAFGGLGQPGPPMGPTAGGNSAGPNPFGQPAQPPANPFGQPVQRQPAAPNPFGQPSTNGFDTGSASAQPLGGGQARGATNGPGGPNATRPHPAYESYARKGPNGTLTSWKGQPVQTNEAGEPCVRSFDGMLTKIWNVDLPTYSADTEAAPEAYTKDVEDQYRYALENGRFKDGIMPEIPPKREWSQWDF